ncbi:TolC family protein [Ancylomarina euxinus]|uniref:TolC family protein n=1 Tax=Ancylomarina euxinus TaxID=2283627 RepID=A0A425Y8F2_9BACT|nr:TolC family protein [Ancylomarina euxinus]MCZ4693403.1 TolC family protein [Ancylomarina euxinus]MUP13630.1 TolC family protein [Ancylomarina euxinus]RRG24728.1 TolC family protein [Ancylomarina euxinus]
MKNIFLIVLLFSLCLGVQAQEKWDLKKCVDYAKEHNIALQLKKLEADVQTNNTKQSKLNLLPSLNGRTDYGFNYGRTLNSTNTYSDQNNESGSLSISSNLTLFDGFKKRNELKQNELDLQATLEDVEKAKEDLALNITSYYLDILFKQELLQVAKDQLKVTQLQIERTSVLVDAGTLPKGTLMEQKAQAAQEELTVVNSQNNLDLSLLDLAQLLDLEQTADFKISIPKLPVLNAIQSMIDPESVFENSLKSRPGIKAANLRLESSMKGLSIAKGDRTPSLSMYGFWGSNYSNDFAEYEFLNGQPNLVRNEMKLSDQLRSRERKAFGFQLDIPIFNGGVVNRNISNAKINIDRSRLNLDNTKNILRKEIQQAHANALAAMKKYFSSETAVSSTEEAFRYTEEKFNLGLVNSVEYNQGKNNLLKAKSNLLQAKYEYIFRTKIIDFYNGVEISL